MSITLTISVLLTNPAKVTVKIYDEILVLKQLDESGINFSSDFAWDGNLIELNLHIAGLIGTTATLIIIKGNSVSTFNGKIQILNKGVANRIFKIDNNKFKSLKNYKTLSSKSIGIKNLDYSSKKHLKSEYKGIINTESTTNVEIDVFYATDRQFENNEKLYSEGRSELTYGTCKVNIPKSKAFGKIPRPTWWKFEFKENRNKHVMILNLTVRNDVSFFQEINSSIQSKEDDSALVFIHGYNSSFKDAIYRTAQITFDLGFKGVPITYSWPSAGETINYPYDEESVLYTHSDMVNFFKDLHMRTGLKKIHLIAHSMGNRALTNSILTLQGQGFFKAYGFDQIIMAAPDVDAQLFLKEFSAKLPESAKRITLYASSGDKALQFSRTIHNSIIRLGESGDLITCCEGIDTIDASKTDTSFLGHGYFASTEALIGDIFHLLNFNHDPGKRNLLKFQQYWSFK